MIMSPHCHDKWDIMDVSEINMIKRYGKACTDITNEHMRVVLKRSHV